jgi:succinate dehydrogenase/fumarate reductase flavoprotein subunit
VESKGGYRVYATDVLVIGVEAAGGFAAIKAGEDEGLDVIAITKGSDIGRAGATVTADHSSFAIECRGLHDLLGAPADTRDSPEAFFEDVVREGKYVNDQTLVESLVRECAVRAKELESWGFEWNKRYFHASPGHTYQREIYPERVTDRGTGVTMCRVMKRVLESRPNSQIMGNMLAVDLLTTGGEITGAVALDLLTGELVVFRAKCVIMATGGAQCLYPYVSTGKEMTGDGHAMAYRAGAEFRDMEYIQFIPGQLIWPPGWTWGVMPFVGVAYFSWWYNGLGDRFMWRWDPVKMENVTRDIWSIAVATEVLEGRGSEHGGMYASIVHLPGNIVDHVGKATRGGWRSHTGFDHTPLIEMMKDGLALEFTNYCHFWMGGIKINADGETSIPGLYAAGECAGGVHGANRLSGGALTQCIVQGARAGIAASTHAKETSRLEVDWEQVEACREWVFRPLGRKGGTNPMELRDQVTEFAIARAGPVRDEEMLEEAIAEADRLKKVELPYLYCKAKSRAYNLEWVQAIQTMNIVQVLEIVAHSALPVKNSRGAHYRRDYPDTDNDDFVKNIVAKQVDGRCEVSFEPVNITSITPPKGRRPYPG